MGALFILSTKTNEQKDYSCLYMVAAIIIFVIAAKGCNGGGSNGPLFPMDNQYIEDLEMEQEIREGKEGPGFDYIPGEAAYDATQEAGGNEWDSDPESRSSDLGQVGTNCPTGCTYHKDGCDIKGNISIASGEKIYHIPGQEYYWQTNIDPEYGERWFCTESEAISNGWRKSYN